MKKSIKICDFCGGTMDSSNENNPWFLHKLKRYRINLEEETNIGVSITYDICAACSKKMLSAMVKPYDNDIVWHEYPGEIPDRFEICLVTTVCGNVREALFYPSTSMHGHKWQYINGCGGVEAEPTEIIAWCKMPEPYIKEEKE